MAQGLGDTRPHVETSHFCHCCIRVILRHKAKSVHSQEEERLTAVWALLLKASDRKKVKLKQNAAGPEVHSALFLSAQQDKEAADTLQFHDREAAAPSSGQGSLGWQL